jgi:DeoR/GlpR family transcriptional regulator of sugar metabolism
VRSQLRHREILEELRREGRVEVPGLAGRLGISAITIRRDLDHLAEAGALRRVRGGAVTTTLRGEGLPFGVRAAENHALKARLAQAAVGLIADGEAVAVDSGTTGAAAAVALAGRRVTAMPFSVQGITALAASSTVALLLPGGSVRLPEGTITGPLAQQTLTGLRFDTAILTCCAAAPAAGVTAYDLEDAAIKRALRSAAERTILIAEGAKFTRSALAVVCALDEVDILVTDDSAPAEALAGLSEAGVRVVTA